MGTLASPTENLDDYHVKVDRALLDPLVRGVRTLESSLQDLNAHSERVPVELPKMLRLISRLHGLSERIAHQDSVTREWQVPAPRRQLSTTLHHLQPGTPTNPPPRTCSSSE
eukprot:NODE_4456_length_660_cov_13.733224_g3807_i0.p1 GENE.NODE_4456_length_660_cov_13.733224_g3807_i0~~NODE_4456_length_660_cov_13.733224_g3807_i0.p1  ORF type:complete len:112 (+),score=27.26 NODE_4456_length_660_cov_13.733224_g3807_i0:35-370(+)